MKGAELTSREGSRRGRLVLGRVECIVGMDPATKNVVPVLCALLPVLPSFPCLRRPSVLPVCLRRITDCEKLHSAQFCRSELEQNAIGRES